MRIRFLRKSDFENGFPETLENLRPMGPVTRRAFNRRFDLISKNPNHFVYVMEEKGVVIGTITLLVEPKFIRGLACAAHIEDVSVRKGYEGKGIGHALVKRAVQKAMRCGCLTCYKVILDCDPKLVTFYTECGFHEDGNHMRLDLIRA